MAPYTASNEARRRLRAPGILARYSGKTDVPEANMTAEAPPIAEGPEGG